MTTWVNSPEPLIHTQGATIFLKPRSHVSEVATLCLYELLEQSGHAPDEMMDVLLGYVVAGRIRDVSEVLNWTDVWEQAGEWIVSTSPSSRTCWPLQPQEAEHCYETTGTQRSNLRCCPSSWPVSRVFPSTTFVGKQGCLQQLKQNKPRTSISIVRPQMLFPKCPTSSQTCSTIRSLQRKTRF